MSKAAAFTVSMGKWMIFGHDCRYLIIRSVSSPQAFFNQVFQRKGAENPGSGKALDKSRVAYLDL